MVLHGHVDDSVIVMDHSDQVYPAVGSPLCFFLFPLVVELPAGQQQCHDVLESDKLAD